jgi:dihydrofolate reductase
MSVLTVEQIVSADGYAADSAGGLDFTEAVAFEDESRTDSEQMKWLETVDAILLGANTYRIFADYWPGADPTVDAVADPINRLPKFVVSNSLERAPWGDGHIDILRGDGAESARSLKERFESIVVWGSLQLADSLLVAGLVDILRLRIVPVLIGNGRSFTPSRLGQQRLHLERAHVHPTGHLGLTYHLR